MRVVTVRNVSQAWARLADTLRGAELQDTAAGPAWVVDTPVVTVYERPTERVLFCPARNANPFFHLMEALWMLAGRCDSAFLNRYVGDFGSRYAESDGVIHGAYGRRWRHTMRFDQLEVAVQKLRANPHDRRIVIQMWDTRERSFYDGSDDLRGQWRDRPCNTHVYLRVRAPSGTPPQNPDANELLQHSPILDLTVLCRSNDAVWGAYGANAVHFSVLHEYLAARAGLQVGRMYQFSNNFHAYHDVWSRTRPSDAQTASAEEVTLGCVPMFDVPDAIDSDLEQFMDWHMNLWGGGADRQHVYRNQWFRHTAERVARSWFSLRGVRSIDAAMAGATAIGCPAWHVACVEWLQRLHNRTR